MTLTTLSGWGRVPESVATVASLSSAAGPWTMDQPRGAIARGLGRSYGDCAQNGGGIVFDLTDDASFILDGSTGVATARGGASLADIVAEAVPRGWFLPVTPGTKHVTVGGAIAGNVHGKNHHRDGAIDHHVTSLELLFADGTTQTVFSGSAEFGATLGGLGLTGIILEAKIQLIPIATSLIAVDTSRHENVDDLMEAMDSGDADYRYSVAWIDLLAKGSSIGRGVLTRGDHASRDALEPTTQSNALEYRSPRSIEVPDIMPSGLLNRFSVRAFNEIWYRKAPRRRVDELQTIESFFYPLDMVGRWNRLYGSEGFLQYQFAVPVGAHETVRTIVHDIASRSLPSFLAVLKRFGPGSGMLSFPIEGWTLALDIPTGLPDLARLLDSFDEKVASVGGRVYLAKDARLRPETFRAMYPEFARWRDVRDRMDPRGIWRSDLARRLELLETRM